MYIRPSLQQRGGVRESNPVHLAYEASEIPYLPPAMLDTSVPHFTRARQVVLLVQFLRKSSGRVALLFP